MGEYRAFLSITNLTFGGTLPSQPGSAELAQHSEVMFVRILVALIVVLAVIATVGARERWGVEKAALWQMKVGWKAGANFVPSTAVNELEMFQADTFDLTTIDRELGYAQDLGFGVIRVFLHNLLWTQDSAGFLDRVDQFLAVSEKHGISVMLVLLDSCWLPTAQLGPQPPPIPGVHNSQWVQAPGSEIINDQAQFDALQPYIQGVVSRFREDRRVLAWDIWNEPDNSGYSDSLIGPLLQKVADWVRAADPTQPLTTPVWTNPSSADYTSFQRLQMDNSDVISFHSYEDATHTQMAITNFKNYEVGRPVICTEYMARAQNSTFEPHMQLMKDANVIAINWGLVSGKIQTIYPWSTCTVPATEPPEVWFHDILNADGTAFNASETSYIRSLTLGGK